jgi:hypothetical protein
MRTLIRSLGGLFVAISIGGVTIALGVVFYWTIIDNRVPIASLSVQTLDKSRIPRTAFKAGEELFIRRENCTARRTLVFISRELVRTEDGITYAMPSNPYIMETGCAVSLNGVQLPPYLMPGKYRYNVTLQYQNNPLSSGQVRLIEPEITIIE